MYSVAWPQVEGNRLTTKRLAVGLAAVALLAALASCSDDDDSSGGKSGGSGTLSKAELGEYCTNVLRVETLPFPQTGDQSDAERAATFKKYAAQLRGLVEKAAAAAPAKVEADLTVVAKGLGDVVAAGGDLTKRGTPAVRSAAARAHAFDLTSCGWKRLDAAAVEFAFQGIPETVAAGVVSFELTNKGTFDHVLELYRLNDGTTASGRELLSKGAPTKEDLAQLTDLGSAFAREGEAGYVVRDLKPGRYIAACLIPLNTSPPSTHASRGMLTEFSVT